MREFGGEALITNAYLLWRKFGSEAARLGVHGILGFEGPIMTDSGAYQLLRYGAVEIDPIEVVKYQESIGSDIATILDVPTGASATRESAENSVKATLRRAEEAQRFRSKENVLWCGPVQGGLFTDLVAKCAKAMGELDYDIHAVGSPVELLEDYRFSDVVRITMAAKLNLPIERPIHLFGVGHPMFFALGVAMGCDLFDSAAYALYARDGRYLTIGGTRKLSELGWFPCDCPVCVRNTPKDVLELPKNEQENFLIRHNLYVSFSEIRTIRQAIVEGTLFELLQQRCRAHPRLLDALREFYKYSSFIEQFDSVSKPSAFFYVGPEDKNRPEVLRHRSKLENYSPPAGKTLILYPAFGDEPKPITTAPNPHYVKVVPPFGPIPEELEEIYPLWQHEIPKEVDEGTLHATLDSVRKFLQKNGEKYVRAEVLADGKLGKLLGELCEEMMGKERVTVRVPDQTLL
jgi:7-cyano-7-deazaguanine tRNA-ribosyltransferase